MNLQAARTTIQAAIDKMTKTYREPVFNEWAIVGVIGGNGRVFGYHGNRVPEFTDKFHKDIAALRQSLESRPLETGDFEFAADAKGTLHDAVVKLGPGTFLILNHTGKSVADLRKDPRWLKVQPLFLELTESFRADPLDLVA